MEPYTIRLRNRDLVGLNPSGRDCEACGGHMRGHAWADLDIAGFVVRCSEQKGK